MESLYSLDGEYSIDLGLIYLILGSNVFKSRIIVSLTITLTREDSHA